MGLRFFIISWGSRSWRSVVFGPSQRRSAVAGPALGGDANVAAAAAAAESFLVDYGGRCQRLSTTAIGSAVSLAVVVDKREPAAGRRVGPDVTPLR